MRSPLSGTPAGHAGGRDKPHSGESAGPTTTRVPGPLAPLVGGLVAAATLAAASPLPGTWTGSAEPPLLLPTPGPLGGLWDTATLWLPVGERGARAGFAALLLALAVAVAAGWFAFHLYRGTGRRAAAFAAIPVCAALLLAWLREADPSQVPATLGFCLAGTLALGLVVGARVHGSGSQGRALVAGGAALIGALLWPRAGVGLAALLLAYLGWTRADRWRRPALAAGLGLAPLLVFGTGLLGHDPTDRSWRWAWWSQLRIAPDLDGLLRGAGAPLLFPALALLVLLVLPLRWRGGGLLLGLAGLGLTLADRSGALAPTPALLVLLGVAVCGWIWLAGSVGGRWAARGATLAVIGVAASRAVITPGPIAATRPEASLLALQQRGLVAPGDVLLAHDPWLALALAAARRDEGVRPDLELHTTHRDPALLAEQLARWEREGRRVLSDSFNDAGRWEPQRVLDSGPLFWSITAPGELEREFTDLRGFSPAQGGSLRADEAARWERMHVERARHRRALGQHDQAMLALPFTDDELAALRQQLQRAELSRLATSGGSELGLMPWARVQAHAGARAEAGDLLFALGGGADGAELLTAAADRGAAEALGALVRWQLRAGEETAASATLQVLATAPVLRPQLLAVCRWLVLRARSQQAALLLAGAPPTPGFAPEELAVRLAALRGLATP